MKSMHRNVIGRLGCCVCCSCRSGISGRADSPQSDLASGLRSGREMNLVGTVSSFDSKFENGPLGAHVVVQSAERHRGCACRQREISGTESN